MAVLTQKNNHEALVSDIDIFSFPAYERVSITKLKPCTNNELKVNIKLTDS